MHPILFRIGHFHLPSYGFILALALIVAIIVAVRFGRREGLNSSQVVDFSTWLIVAGLIGAKAYMLFTDWISHIPVQIFSLSTLEAGGGIWGALIGSALFATIYVKGKRWSWAKVFDAVAPAVAIGQCIGRWGCFAAGDDYGKPAYHSHFAVVYTNHYAHAMTGVPLHVPLYPVQLIESGLMLISFLILITIYPRKTRDGQIFAMYLMLYGAVRFYDEFYRGDPDRGFFFHGALSTAQVVSIVAFIAGLVLIYVLQRHGHPPEPAVSAPVEAHQSRP